MLEQSVTDFIEAHAHLPLAEVALKLGKRKELPKEYILNQINGRQRAVKKFPFLIPFKNFHFPNQRALEQASSEKASLYKSQIKDALTIADLSGGMGIDSYFFSKNAKKVFFVEQNPDLATIASANFKCLNAEHIAIFNQTAREFLTANTLQFDLIYIDPDRRVSKEKAFKIEDCEPNISQLFPQIFEKTDHCLIKLSPMLDISQALHQISFCKEVHVLSIDNDCKELLFLLENNFTPPPIIKTINIGKQTTEKFEFELSAEKEVQIEYGLPETFIYEPNTAVLKAGAFKSIASAFNLKKISPNTHLYTSSKHIHNFPGKVLKIKSVGSPQKNLVHQANIVSRNFPLSVHQIKKKYKIKDGGSKYIFACKLYNDKAVFILAE